MKYLILITMLATVNVSSLFAGPAYKCGYGYGYNYSYTYGHGCDYNNGSRNKRPTKLSDNTPYYGPRSGSDGYRADREVFLESGDIKVAGNTVVACGSSDLDNPKKIKVVRGGQKVIVGLDQAVALSGKYMAVVYCDLEVVSSNRPW
ncbi:MAG: hypothetical protein ISR65_09280 [Bacteriovoracaceae bacterium]|nr:hypothetical protein [Bacteriovoracaceae bacterium]